MTSTAQPVMSEMSRAEADELLARNWIARIAYSWHDHVDVEPIHYVYDAPWLFGRTGVGAKLLALAHNQWCAVEVDEIDDLFDWRCVVVKGPFSAFNSTLGETQKYEQAVEALRRLVPNVFREGDPAPERTIVFGIHASEVAGRRMASSG